MHLFCATEHFARAIRAVARLRQGKDNPSPPDVLLVASHLAHEQGQLAVVGWRPQMRAGLFAALPARVERPGQVRLHAPGLADYLAALPAGELQLTQETPPDLETTPTEMVEQPARPPLQIACTWTSARGTGVARHARFLVQAWTEQDGLPIAEWMRTGVQVATLTAREFRAALAPCISLANRRGGKEHFPDMFGVLVRFDAEGLLFTATTRYDLATSRLALPCAHLFTHSSHALFQGSDLVWMSKTLRDDEQIHLRLVRNVQQAVLLVSTAEGTLFCKGRTTDLPVQWEQPPHYPIEAHILIEREAFEAALARFAVADRDDEANLVELRTEANQLVLRLVCEQDDLIQMQTTLAVLLADSPMPAILLDLGRTRFLVHTLQGPQIRLAWGRFVRQQQEQRQVIGFLRLTSESSQTTLIIVRSDTPGEAEATEAIPPPVGTGESTQAVATPASPDSAEQPTVPLPAAPSAPVQLPETVPSILRPVLALSRKESLPMSIPPTLLAHQQADDALHQLGWYYHRQFLQASLPPESREACAWLRDQFLSATSQQAIWEHLMAQAGQDWSEPGAVFWKPFCQQAAGLLRQVIDAGGSIHSLVAGITDGFRHFCLRCGQDDQKREDVRFFQERDRRWLLTPEVGNAPRSVYDRCQFCLQPLAPGQVVVFVPAGTLKHVSGCACQQCNQRALAFVINIYACDPQTQQIMLPRLAQAVAPSRPQCVERAVALCWREGWYMHSEEPRTHALSPLALAPIPPEKDAQPQSTPIA